MRHRDNIDVECRPDIDEVGWCRPLEVEARLNIMVALIATPLVKVGAVFARV
jgi:hypothetical protein